MGGKGDTQDQLTSKSTNWHDIVNNMMIDLQVDIMKEIQISISSQIEELALTITIQVKIVLQEALA